MNRSQFVFKLIDIFMNEPQNGAVKFDGIKVIKNIPYSDKGANYTQGDIYVRDDLFEKGDKIPVVLNIHGGGFVMGDKKYRYGISSWWADKGYFVFNISYRLCPDVHFPENVVDLVDAMNFLQTLAKDYPMMDLSKVVVTGDSSGGYSAAYLAAVAFNDKLRKELSEASGFQIDEVKVKPALIAPCCGIYNIDTLVKNPMPLKLIDVTAETMLGFKLEPKMTNFKEYPLVKYLSPEDFITSKWPPVFMIWSWDDSICIGQGRTMYNAVCRRIGKKNIGFYAAKGITNNHCFHLILATEHSKKSLDALAKFCEEKLDYHFEA